MPELIIRPLLREEAEEVASFCVRAHSAVFGAPELPRRTAGLAKAWAGKGAGDGVFVARDDEGKLIGVAIVRRRGNGRVWPAQMRSVGPIPPGAAALELVAVPEGSRRKGIGAALVARAIEYAGNHGCKALISVPISREGEELLSALGCSKFGSSYELLLDRASRSQPPPLSLPRRLALPLFKPSAFWDRLSSGGGRPALALGAALIVLAVLPEIIRAGRVNLSAAAAIFLSELARFLSASIVGGVILLGLGTLLRRGAQLIDALRLSMATLLVSAGFCSGIGLLSALLGAEPGAILPVLGILMTIHLIVPGIRSVWRWPLGWAILAGLAVSSAADFLGLFNAGPG